MSEREERTPPITGDVYAASGAESGSVEEEERGGPTVANTAGEPIAGTGSELGGPHEPEAPESDPGI
jgi:hypothetical protein